MIEANKRNIVVIIGIVAWICAAAFVHFVPVMFDGGFRTAFMFALAIPLGWLTMRLVETLTKPSRFELGLMLCLGTLTALMLDGLATAFYPTLYAGISSATQYGAAWIMWGAGVGMLMPFFRHIE